MSNKKIDTVSYILLTLIVVIFLIIQNPYVLIIIATVLLFKITKTAGWSFFSELSILLWYAYFEGFIQKTIGVTNNTLAWAGEKMPYYYSELSIASLSFLLIALGFIQFTKIVNQEKQLYEIDLNISFSISLMLVILSSVIIILVFPSFPTFTTNLLIRRTQGLSSFYGLVLFSLFLSSLTVDQSYKHKILYIFYAFIIFWSFGHTERVEVLGFLSYVVLKSINYYRAKIDFKAYKRLRRKFYIIIILVLISAMYIGLTRTDRSAHISVSDLFNNFLVQGTAGDVTYIFNCATDLWKNGHAVHGITYIDYILRLIPGFNSMYSSEKMLHAFYPDTMGGQLFYAEAMMNFGIIGTIIMNLEFFIVMKLIVFRKTMFRAYFIIPIIIEVYRTAYYGRASWLLACCVEVPIIYFGIWILRKVFYRRIIN